MLPSFERFPTIHPCISGRLLTSLRNLNLPSASESAARRIVSLKKRVTCPVVVAYLLSGSLIYIYRVYSDLLGTCCISCRFPAWFSKWCRDSDPAGDSALSACWSELGAELSAWCPIVHGEIAPDPGARRPGGARAVLRAVRGHRKDLAVGAAKFLRVQRDYEPRD